MTIEKDIVTGKIRIDGQILSEPLLSLAQEYLNIQSEVNILKNAMNQKFAELVKTYNALYGVGTLTINEIKEISEDITTAEAEEIPQEPNLQMIERNIDLQKQFKSFHKDNSQD